MSRRVSPALALLLLAGLIAEVLTGFRPLVTLLTEPVAFVAFLLYYGTAALLARELAFRWHKGWPTVLALGAVFGIVQEGLGTKVFFDSTRADLGSLVGYGVAEGVQWPFVVQLIVYHAAYSIGLPVLLTSVLYPRRIATSWASGRWLVACAVCVILVTWLLTLVYRYPPPPGPYALAIVAAVLLFGVARLLPGKALKAPLAQTAAPRAPGERPPRPRWFWGVGTLAMAGFLVVSYVPPSLGMPAAGTALAILVPPILAGWWLRRRTHGWDSQRQWALAAGLLTPWIILAPTRDASGALGTTVAALIVAFVLWRAWRRIHTGPSAAAPPIPHPAP